MTRPPRILIIAGSDNSGGAGIQADIKTVTMLGGYAMTAITALTAQNTTGVFGVQPVPAAFVIDQIDTAMRDIGADAVKIGMIGSAETAAAVADYLAALPPPVRPTVFDPVMIATSGGVLADAATIAAFGKLMRLASVTTPNLDELAALGGEAAVLGTGSALLIKGGHASGDTLTDTLVFPDGTRRDWSDPRIATRSTHGTGCTLASAIATGLGAGLNLEDAVTKARCFVRAALEAAPGFGQGHGPMGHQAVNL